MTWKISHDPLGALRRRRSHPRIAVVDLPRVVPKRTEPTLANSDTKLLETRSKRMSDQALTTCSTPAGLGWSYYARFYAWRFS
jgi:hypothetical protein